MNAELPAFDKTLEDKAFAEALEEDGLPPLYPNQPRWAFEDGRGGAEAADVGEAEVVGEEDDEVGWHR